MSRRAKLTAGIGIAAAASLALDRAAKSRARHLSDDATGDPALVERAGALLRESAGPRDKASITVVDKGQLTEAHFGADAHTEYEIGSLTKPMTGMIFANMIDRGEVDPAESLGEFFDLGDSDAAAIRLHELATHTSGLRTAGAPLRTASHLAQWLLLQRDPSANVTLDQLLDDARRASLGPCESQYSNLGYSLLGQALAARAGMSFPELIAQRLFTPLGMSETYVPRNLEDLSANAQPGYSMFLARKSAPWTLGAEALSGSVRSTPNDMSLFLRALLDGTAPGMEAAREHARINENRAIGYGWLIDNDGLMWHNGMTGGFSSWLSFDRSRNRGVVVLSNTMNSVDDVGMSLAESGGAPDSS